MSEKQKADRADEQKEYRGNEQDASSTEQPQKQDDSMNSHQKQIADTRKRSSKGLLAFVAAFMVLCLLPFAGMLWTNDGQAQDGGTLSTLPELRNADGSINLYYFQGLGDYFEDHYAYRNNAIDINAHIRADLFKTSPTDQVIVGENGWLFYGGTLSDYLATDPLSEREVRNIAHNLSLMQGYAEAMGAEFLFTIAPNKNSLYPEHMPYYYLDGTNESMDRLRVALEEKNINYTDLFELFESAKTTEGELYCKTDSHWTTEGALQAANLLLESSGNDAAGVISSEDSEVMGDIEKMLYPVTAQPEASLLIQTGEWEYAGEAESVEDTLIDTVSDAEEGSLLMYRDSFANTLIPHLAPEFSDALFSKLVPYNLTEIAELKPTVVIVERAQRHVNLFSEEAPFMYAPTSDLKTGDDLETESWASWYADGGFRVIEGAVDEAFIGVDDDIYIRVEGPKGEAKTYVPFHISIESASGDVQDSNESLSVSEYGFRLYLNESSLTEGDYTISVMVLKPHEDEAYVVRTASLKK